MKGGICLFPFSTGIITQFQINTVLLLPGGQKLFQLFPLFLQLGYQQQLSCSTGNKLSFQHKCKIRQKCIKIESLADLMGRKHRAKQPHYWQLHKLHRLERILIIMLQRKPIESVQELNYMKLHLTALKLTEIKQKQDRNGLHPPSKSTPH